MDYILYQVPKIEIKNTQCIETTYGSMYQTTVEWQYLQTTESKVPKQQWDMELLQKGELQHSKEGNSLHVFFFTLSMVFSGWNKLFLYYSFMVFF